MPCYQSTNLPSGVTTTGRTGYATEADCNQACKEGACCAGTVCTVKPQCQCQGTGQTFKGVGTVCSPNPCLPCPCVFGSPYAFPVSATFTCQLETVTARLKAIEIVAGKTAPCSSQYSEAFRQAVGGFSVTAPVVYSFGQLFFDADEQRFFSSIGSDPCSNGNVLQNAGKTDSTLLASLNCNGTATLTLKTNNRATQIYTYLAEWESAQNWAVLCEQLGQAAYGSVHKFRLYLGLGQQDSVSASLTRPCDGQASPITSALLNGIGYLNRFGAPACEGDGAEFDVSARVICTFNYLP